MENITYYDDNKEPIRYNDNYEVEFHDYECENISQLVISRDTKINGLVFEANTYLNFHGDGTISGGRLKEVHDINRIKYEAVIRFRENGKVAWGTLAEKTKINGKTYKAQSLIEFDENGKVIDGTLVQ